MNLKVLGMLGWGEERWLKMSIVPRRRKQHGGSFCCKTETSTSAEISVAFLILKMRKGISESLAGDPAARDDEDPGIPSSRLTNTVCVQTAGFTSVLCS